MSPDTSRRNHYTILDAREAMWRAATLKQFKDDSGNLLTDGTNGPLFDLPPPIDSISAFSSDPIQAKAEHRDAYWATAFRALGDVLHLIEDMAQPQHTRGEPHPFFPATYFERLVEARALTDMGTASYSATLVPFAVQLENLTPLNYASSVSPRFVHYSDYWSTAAGGDIMQGLGMADYSNRGFFTLAHGFGQGTYAHPSSTAGDYTKVIAPDANGQLWDYLDGTVPDLVSGTSPPIHMARISAFVDAASGAGVGPTANQPPTLDQAVFDQQADLLIPRAVGYSAGLLNFFFRGQMVISPPDAGFYAIVDHSEFVPSQDRPPTDVMSGFKGFSKVKLKLKNTTADIIPSGATDALPQDMPDGILVAVLKFHRNLCYDDLLVNLPTSTTSAFDCRSPNEEIVVSKPLAQGVPQGTDSEPDGSEIAFDFPQNLPINAWDVVLQVVYRGLLGTESDAVVVATKNISEPTFVTYYNTSDYVVLDDVFYKPQDVTPEQFTTRVNPACRQLVAGQYAVNPACYNFQSAFKFTAAASNVTISATAQQAVAPRHLVRFALLADLGPYAHPSLHWDINDVTCYVFLENPILVSPMQAQNSGQSGWTYGIPINVRGVKLWDGVGCYADIGSTLSDPNALNPTTLDPIEQDEKAPTPVTITGWDDAPE